jgi:hypothetical protein
MRYAPAVGSLGTNYLVVWQDYRNGSSSKFDSDIFGARVTGNGALMDTTGIAICTKTNSQFHPSVAANGTNYLVVWEDYSVNGNDIYGARVNADGLLVETNGFPISTAVNAQSSPALTSVKGDFFVAWQDFRNSTTNEFAADICAARVLGDGTVLDPGGLEITTASDSQWSPGIAGNATELLVVWQDFRDNPAAHLSGIHGARAFGPFDSFVLSDFAISSSANAELTPEVGFDPSSSSSFVVWADSRNLETSGFEFTGALSSTEWCWTWPRSPSAPPRINKHPRSRGRWRQFPNCLADFRNTDQCVAGRHFGARIESVRKSSRHEWHSDLHPHAIRITGPSLAETSVSSLLFGGTRATWRDRTMI